MTTLVEFAIAIGLALVGQVRAAELPHAAQVLNQTGVSAGLAVVVGTIDGRLETELTNGGGQPIVRVVEKKRPHWTDLVTEEMSEAGKIVN